MPSGKSKSFTYPNGVRRVEAETGKRLAPRSLRPERKYLEDCADDELDEAQISREKKAKQSKW